MKQVKVTKEEKKQKVQKDIETFPLTKENYILGAIGLLIIIIGYILMAGKENIFGFTKMTLSVTFVNLGFAFIIYAIMKKPKNTEEQS